MSRKRRASDSNSVDHNEKKKKKTADCTEASVLSIKESGDTGRLVHDALTAIKTQVKGHVEPALDFRFESATQFLHLIVQAKGLFPDYFRKNLSKTVPESLRLFDSWFAKRGHIGQCDPHIAALFCAFHIRHLQDPATITSRPCLTNSATTALPNSVSPEIVNYLYRIYHKGEYEHHLAVDFPPLADYDCGLSGCDCGTLHLDEVTRTLGIVDAVARIRWSTATKFIAAVQEVLEAVGAPNHSIADDRSVAGGATVADERLTAIVNKVSSSGSLSTTGALLLGEEEEKSRRDRETLCENRKTAVCAVALLYAAVVVDRNLGGLFDDDIVGMNPYLHAVMDYSDALEKQPPAFVSPGEIVLFPMAIQIGKPPDTQKLCDFLLPLKVTAVRVMKPFCKEFDKETVIKKVQGPSCPTKLCSTELWEYSRDECDEYWILGTIPGFESLPGCCYLACQLADEVLPRANEILDALYAKAYSYDAPRQPLTPENLDSTIERAPLVQQTAFQVIEKMNAKWKNASNARLLMLASYDGRAYLETIRSFMENLLSAAATAKEMKTQTRAKKPTAEGDGEEGEEKEEKGKNCGGAMGRIGIASTDAAKRICPNTEDEEKAYEEWRQSDQGRKWTSIVFRDGMSADAKERRFFTDRHWMPASCQLDFITKKLPPSETRQAMRAFEEAFSCTDFSVGVLTDFSIGALTGPRFVTADVFDSLKNELSSHVASHDVSLLILSDYCGFTRGPSASALPFLFTTCSSKLTS